MNFSLFVSAQFAQTLCNFSAAEWCAGKMFNGHLETALSTT